VLEAWSSVLWYRCSGTFKRRSLVGGGMSLEVLPSEEMKVDLKGT
jgi:hypothetical protein